MNNSKPIKTNGIYYTPTPLAEYLVSPLINQRDVSIFDPAYGEGALLLAAERAYKAKFSFHKDCPQIYGCDKLPSNGPLKHLNQDRLVKQDFFDYPSNNKFDLIFMNPPYVRHHSIAKTKRERYQKKIHKLCNLKQTADLWAYFLIKATDHLKKGGDLGVIVPWSFLQAEYAQDVRVWLSKMFESIKVLALSAEYFNDAEERVILVWLKNYGTKVRFIKLAYSDSIHDEPVYSDLSKNQWESCNIAFSGTKDIDKILHEYTAAFNFKKLSDCGEVKIGVVTGADDFFIVTDKIINEYCFENKHLIPILKTSKELRGLYCGGYEASNRLLYLSGSSLPVKYKGYIKKGKSLNYHKRAHSLLRETWYHVDVKKIPDAFFPYRATYIPYMVLNDSKFQCTNSIHRVYFNNLTTEEKRWMQISLLSAIGQLSLEAFSKVYGKSVLKIEPRALKNALVYISKRKLPASTYNKISSLLSSNDRNKASAIATEFIGQTLKIPDKLLKNTKSVLRELQRRRLSRLKN